LISKNIQTVYPKIADWGGKTTQIRRLIEPDNKRWSAFNPSIAYSPELGYAATIRSSNYVYNETLGTIDVTDGGMVKNKVWFADLDQNTLEILDIREVQFELDDYSLKRGIEDAKLFWRDGSWYFSGIMLERGHTDIPRVCLYRYDHKLNIASLVKKWGGPDVFRPEKNWMFPYDNNPNFDCVYGSTGIVKDDKLIATFSNQYATGGLRGGSNLWKLADGGYLGVMHTLYLKTQATYNPRTFGHTMSQQRRYTHQFVKFDNFGKLCLISEEFVFDSLQIEFAAGLVEKDGNYVISYGVNDVAAKLAVIPVGLVHDKLMPLETKTVDVYLQPIP
jgi:hypothetical protein